MARPEEIRRLTEEGCTVLCLDCPEGILFGIDYSAWTVGPRFMGVKLVPPGLHYVYCSPSGEDVGAFRTGFFLNMKQREVAVFRWDPVAEELTPLPDADEEARYADGARAFDFDGQLGPYPLELSAQWEELTRYANERLVRKIEPVARAVRSKRAEYDKTGTKGAENDAEEEAEAMPSFDELDDGSAAKKQQERPSGTEQLDQPANPQAPLESNAGGHLFFSAVPRTRKRKGASAAETTQLHMDRTGQLDEMIAREYGGDALGILGELQLAYIAFILGQNCDGFDQWRALLQLLCSCDTGVRARPDLFAELLRAFFAQLSQAPNDLFEDDLTSGSFLGSCAVSLLDLCEDEASPAKLRKRCGKLRELVREKFGLGTEDLALIGEDAPVVVDADGRDLVDLAGPGLVDMD